MSSTSQVLAALELHARQYAGGITIGHGRRETRYDGARYLGLQKDGRAAWVFGHDHDAYDFADDALRICAEHGIDAELTKHPNARLGSTIVLVRLDEPPVCGHNACSQHFIDTGSRECVLPAVRS